MISLKSEETIESEQEVFNIPKEKDRVLVRKGVLTPQRAADVCQTLANYLADNGMVSNKELQKTPPELFVKITVHATKTEPSIPVYEVELQQDQGVWGETFGDIDVLNSFLLGVSAGLSFKRHPLFFCPRVKSPISGWNLLKAPYQIWPEQTSEE